MNLYDYSYISMPDITGEISVDLKNILTINNKAKTYTHLIAVAKTNGEIAEIYNLNKDKCIMGGLLHDISTVIKPNDMLEYAQKYNMEIDEAESKYSFLLHQRISKLLACDFFHITDNKILSAIECHTTLKNNPTKYDMALFIADKLSWDKEGKPPYYNAVKVALQASLEKASLVYIDYIIENNMVLYPHQWLLNARDYLKSILS